MIKKTRKSSAKSAGNGMPSRYLAERKRLHKEITDLKAERDQYKKSLIALMREEITVSKEEMLALFGKEPPLEDLIAELEAQEI